MLVLQGEGLAQDVLGLGGVGAQERLRDDLVLVLLEFPHLVRVVHELRTKHTCQSNCPYVYAN